jgi:isoamylase
MDSLDPHSLQSSRGKTHPLGASDSGDGWVNFAVFSRHAHAIDLCLYSPQNREQEVARIRLHQGEPDIWHVALRGLPEGTCYGYRAHGAWLPDKGLRFNAKKLLLDPYARAIVGDHNGRMDMGTEPDPRNGAGRLDNGETALKSVYLRGEFDWGGDRAPAVPWDQTVIYELHVRGFTKLHPGVPEEKRGTYAGLAEPVVIDYLRDLGVTSVQILPVHTHLDDGFLVHRGLTNFWGYNSIGFFSPHAEYAAASDPVAQVREFKEMVKALHAAGIEVILDVVYNHTAEGDEHGPALMFRGLDNVEYYRLGVYGETLHYRNLTGCGNSVASHQSGALRLIIDSLRYWVTEMHVDGFRFDLAVTVARSAEHFDRESAFFNAVAQDPVLCGVKLIAEPWDVGAMDSYQVGNFPHPWRELNGKFRDTVRSWWAGDVSKAPEFAKRLCGSQDVYGWNHRPPLASVNFVTSHDGFTLRDLVSYLSKHNEANREDNRDGDNQNHSNNWGVEGETDDVEILTQRGRVARSMLASVFFAQGVPFLTAGDERWRTQGGNNNAYCQDGPISWIDWTETAPSREMLEFTKALLRARKQHSALRRHSFLTGVTDPGTVRRDVLWLNGSGGRLTSAGWHEGGLDLFGAIIEPEHRLRWGDEASSDSRPLLLLFNQATETQPFVIPGAGAATWRCLIDSTLGGLPALALGAASVMMPGHACGLFVLESDSGSFEPLAALPSSVYVHA